LSERSGGRFDAGRHAVFGMAGRFRSELPKLFDVVETDCRFAGRFAVCIDLFDARKMQQRIQQHRCMTDREDKAIAIRPVRCVRIEAQEIAP
jgi:hypothetical protein